MTDRNDTAGRAGRRGGTTTAGRRATTTGGGGATEATGNRVQRAAALLAGIGAVATGLLAVGHAGVELPLVSALGPGGDRAVWPAAIAFSVAAASYTGVAAGLIRGRTWAVPAGVILFAATVAGALTPYRGPASLLGALFGATGLVLLGACAARRRRPFAGDERRA